MSDKVRKSAAAVTEAAEKVKIDEAGLDAFAASLKSVEPKVSDVLWSSLLLSCFFLFFVVFSPCRFVQSPPQFPLQFSERSRVNFECVRSLLEFGSGFRLVLKQHSGRGAHETITAGVFGLFISSGDISAATMVGQSLFDVSTLFEIPLSDEQAVEGSLAGVMTQYVDTTVKPLAVFIHRVLVDSGRILQARKCQDFFELIVRELKPSAAQPIEADRLIEMMCAYFPACK